MTDTTVYLLTVALIAESVALALSVFFVCKLVEKVAPLKAANNVFEYQSLRSAMRNPRTDERAQAPEVGSGETAGDGTLTDDASQSLAARI